jgi:predicted permease
MLQDLRFSLRTLMKRPGFSAVAILSLALGIGANTAIFSLVNSIRLSRLPVTRPDELVILSDPANSGVDIGWDTGDRELITYPEFLALQEQSKSFSSLMASQSSLLPVQARVNGGDPEEMQTRMVSGEYFSTLGVATVVGRTFAADEARKEGGAPFAVISHDFWQRRFGGRADAVGSSLSIYGSVFTIIGVTPSSFFGETVGQRPDVWLPLSMQTMMVPGRDWLHDRPGSLDKVMWLHVFGRLAPNTSIDQARAEVNTIFQRGLIDFYGGRSVTGDEQRRFLNQRLNVRPAETGASRVRGQFTGPLLVLLSAAAVVLLIACANLGNLLLARATARHREVSVRLALGVSRLRLIRSFLVESLLLAVLGGIVGLGVASVIRAGLLLLVPATIQLPPARDLRILGFAFALTLLVGLVLGLLPALRAASVDFAAGLREQSRGLVGSALWQRVGRVVVVAQLALSLPLLVIAGLLLQTLSNLDQVNLGYERERLITVRVNVETAGYEPARRLPVFEQMLERVRAVPGVQAASYARNGVFSGSSSDGAVVVEGYTPQGKSDAGSSWDHVGPDYFTALGVPMLLGREISEEDRTTGQRVCVINEAFAKLFFAGRNPLGLRIGTENACQIVGVARNMRSRDLRGDVEHQYYMPISQAANLPREVRFAIRTAGEPSGVVRDVQRALRQLNENLSITPQLFTELVDTRIAQDRLLARLSLSFGVVGLILAAIGLYGVLSFNVSRRTAEIGIRKALGAQQREVISMVMKETGLLVVIGLIAGLSLAVMSTRLIATRVFGLEPTDPATFALAIGILVGVSLLAAWLPSYRASRVDPLVALRTQ